ncbi:hypothetical protein NM208_g2036 [Fusarium decemcellulare]|uniref:Uncharacterized protein n=1 Tax=Fusarium decemcellulare TaxID=57161 RepID=A0ACC1STZ9_9HYPO|nr:hypothetical protein NM208_g2036 [Fusarium decemcellulare]
MAWSSFATAAPQPVEKRATPELSLTAQLRLADTAVDRFKLLPDDKDFVFDFTKAEAGLANAKSFPALVGTGASLILAPLEPCSMVLVHLHPRAAEVQAVISGHIYTEMVPEAGVVDAEGNQRVIRNELGPNMMTIFYQGSFHTQVNMDCEPATLATFFASEDMGAGLVANQIFALKNDTISRTFGETIAGEDIERVRDALPKGAVAKVDQCLAKCGIKKREA